VGEADRAGVLDDLAARRTNAVSDVVHRGLDIELGAEPDFNLLFDALTKFYAGSPIRTARSWRPVNCRRPWRAQGSI
jgi:hypothetical protein